MKFYSLDKYRESKREKKVLSLIKEKLKEIKLPEIPK